FDREMAGVETMHLGGREVGEVRLTACGCEEQVALPPEDQRLGLTLAEERLPLWVQRQVGSVVEEQIEMQSLAVWPLQERDVRIPRVGAHECWLLRPLQIDRPDGVAREECAERLLRARRARLPESVEPLPRRAEPDLVGVGVLNDQPLERVGVRVHQTK